MDTAKAFSSAAGNTAKKIFGQAAQSLRTSDSFSRGNDRYPNLSKYLTLSELLIKIFYIIGLVVLVLGLAVVAFYLVPALTAQEGFLIGLAALVGSIVVGALYFLFLWLWRMTALATMEFVRVIMDIEQNTRNS